MWKRRGRGLVPCYLAQGQRNAAGQDAEDRSDQHPPVESSCRLLGLERLVLTGVGLQKTQDEGDQKREEDYSVNQRLQNVGLRIPVYGRATERRAQRSCLVF